MRNMALDDVLTILGRAGSVTLRRGTNDVSATPGHVANTRGWSCEVSLAGYNNTGGTRSWVTASAATAQDAAEACLSKLERYLASPAGRGDRERYEQHHATMVSLADRRATSDSFGGRYKHPGPIHPPVKIEYGD
jgi:hypothetical protein